MNWTCLVCGEHDNNRGDWERCVMCNRPRGAAQCERCGKINGDGHCPACEGDPQALYIEALTGG